MSKRYKVGILGATGMVGQKFLSLLKDHPWFEVSVLAASARSARRTYQEIMSERNIQMDVSQQVLYMVIKDAMADADEIAQSVDFVFCAIDLPKDQTIELEERYAKLECPVISNNGANRDTPDIPVVIPEINAQHLDVIKVQQKRLGTKRGFIAVKSNCSLQSYVPALHPLLDCEIKKVLVCTYQAISGAGRTFQTWPEMCNNVIPYIGGEEEKSQFEPLKIWGVLDTDRITNALLPDITAQCLRVPVTDGHFAAVFFTLKHKLNIEEIKLRWAAFSGEPQRLALPSAPKQFLHYFEQPERPQVALDVNLENGMSVSIGRLRADTQYDYKFVSLSHNTVRGAAGGAILTAELLCVEPDEKSTRSFYFQMKS